ncbi:MAG: rod shape-determining protein [Marinisporobacter sp.]|jgi:rod shape-determining protein MreB|nr:rod shape-determining protein [Marinisporobacter sp.]
MFGLGMEVGIDLGTASVLVFIKGKGIVLKEPSVVAIDKNTNKLLAVGEEARRMLGRTPGNIVAIRPLKDGVISDYEVTERMLRYFIHKTCGKRKFFKPKIIVCVPSGVTEVEKRAAIEATSEAGGGTTYLIEEPIAAAIGAGLDISKPDGNMVVDIGGGTADVAVISLGGVVASKSIKCAGDRFDQSIVKHMRKKHNLLIGERTAESLKMSIGSAYPRTKIVTAECRGRDLVSGLPRTIKVTSEEMLYALEEPVMAIADAVHAVLERTPPELAADISDRGIVMTGGGCLLDGLNKLIEERTGIPTYIAEDPIECVAKGTGASLESINVLEKSMMSSKDFRRSR